MTRPDEAWGTSQTETLIESLKGELPDTPPNEIRVAVILLLSRPVHWESEPASTQSGELKEEIPTLWGRWLDELAQLAPEGSEWDTAEDFCAKVLQVAAQKRAERLESAHRASLQEQLGASLLKLETFSGELAYLELPWVGDREIPCLSQASLERAVTLATDFHDVLVQYREVCQQLQQARTRSERETLREREQALVLQSVSLHKDLLELIEPGISFWGDSANGISTFPEDVQEVTADEPPVSELVQDSEGVFPATFLTLDPEPPRLLAEKVHPEPAPNVSSEASPFHFEEDVATQPNPADKESASTTSVSHQEEDFQTSSTVPALLQSEEEVGAEETTRAWEALIWQLIENSRLGLAGAIAERLNQVFPDTVYTMPAPLIRAVNASQYLISHEGELASHLMKDIDEIQPSTFSDANTPPKTGLRFLAIAALLRSAFFVPTSPASSILSNLKIEGMNHLNGFCYQILSFRQKCAQPIPVELLVELNEKAKRANELEVLKKEVRAWEKLAPDFNFNFGRARAVWRKWLASGQIISRLISPILQDDFDRAGDVEELCATFSDQKNIREAVNQTDKNESNYFREIITAEAFQKLVERTAQGVTFARRWLAYSQKGEANRRYLQPLIAGLSSELKDIFKSIPPEFDEYLNGHPPQPVAGGLRVCLAAIKNFIGLFQPDRVIEPEPSPPVLLEGDKLLMASLVLDGQEMFKAGPPALLTRIASAPPSAETDGEIWNRAFSGFVGTRDHVSCRNLINFLETPLAFHNLNLDELRERHQEGMSQSRTVVRLMAKQTRQAIENGIGSGLIGISDRSEFISKVENIELTCATDEGGLGEALNFQLHQDELDRIQQDIQRKRKHREDEIRLRLVSEVGENPHKLAAVEKALEEGDLWRANEFLSQSILEWTEDENNKVLGFTRFFPEQYGSVYDFLENSTKSIQIVQDLKFHGQGRRKSRIGPLDMGPVAGKQAAEAAEMMEAWFEMKKTRRISEANARKLIEGLGFQVNNLTITQSGPQTTLLVSSPILQDKEQCPLPAYGSIAAGSYRFMCVWDRPTEDELISQVEPSLRLNATIILYFGRMPEKRRRELAKACRERRRSFLVLDETILFSLCGERGSRLPVFFRYTIPFAFNEPFAATAGQLHPELFYGRKQEIDDTVNVQGSCFIYGGRQLGKTVLLRRIEQQYHRPEEGLLVKWIDLKAEQIGDARTPDDIWPVILRELRSLNVVPEKTPESTGPEKLLDYIQKWIERTPGGRILLLLDEADAFLQSDETENFNRLTKIKKAMDATGRRFKVVFAGLHNVLRTTQIPNHPLAHFASGRGGPICIGPLLENNDFQEARALIERTFATLGYLFDPPDLVLRILSQTNYYPSLIQLYCAELLRHLQKCHFDDRHTPPYRIVSNHLDEAYQSKGLQQEIRDRFIWTLQLDERYSVIAYAIAWMSIEHPEVGLAGFSVDQILTEALYWWKEGFEGANSRNSCDALLDEMVGLGILRKTRKEHYTLRNPNLILLMGTGEEIGHELTKQREKPLNYDPNAFRSALGTSPEKRNPFTASQTRILKRRNEVSIVYGTEAAGFKDIEIALESDFSREFLLKMDQANSFSEFENHLKSVLDKRLDSGHTLLFIPSECPWSKRWVEVAVERVKRLTSKQSFVHVLFAADPKSAGAFILDLAEEPDCLQRLGVNEISLEAWKDAALRRWLDDCGFRVEQPLLEQVSRFTGNWPSLLYEFFQFSKAGKLKVDAGLKPLEERLQNPEHGDKLCRAFGITPELQVVLSVFFQFPEGLSVEEATLLIETFDADKTRRVIQLARNLNLLVPAVRDLWSVDSWRVDSWRLDPLVVKILEMGGAS